MHGRLKLRPPDAARRRQREEKLRLYREAMDTLLGEPLPDQVLSLTGSVLAANPDVGTCWNLRRRVLGALGGDWVPSELSFVGQCLGVNPKSYGAWHHRGWVLARAPPAGREDLALCERLLAADPRNFHAWEHRRTLVARQDAEAELAFAGDLLSRDFSNFSAWHHRLRLLAPSRDCGAGGGGALPPQRMKEELELVQNAVFTDPTDQSAWVYLRCILSRAPPPPRVICVHVDREDATVAVVFSRPVKVDPECPELTVRKSVVRFWVNFGWILVFLGSQPELSQVAAEALPRILGEFWESPNPDPKSWFVLEALLEALGEGVQPWLPQVLPRISGALESPRGRELGLSALHALGEPQKIS
uniref:Geranylgeranyl transferase type-2 subunit alpha n=1 Tax=Ficedula albicollis TaxID=59894 RepID=U3JVP8_FICAL